MLARMLGLHKSFSPVMQDYWKRVTERPAYLAAKQIQKESAQALAA